MPAGGDSTESKPERVGRVVNSGHDDVKVGMALMAFLSCLRQAWGQDECSSSPVGLRPADEDTSWVMKLIVVCLVLSAMSGFTAGWRMRSWWRRMTDAGPAAPAAVAVVPAAAVAAAAAATMTRTMSTQSQVTYQWHWGEPRFSPLGPTMQGAWRDNEV